MADAIEEAFASATGVLLGKQMRPFAKYSKWAGKRIPPMRRAKSAVGEGMADIPDYAFYSFVPVGRVANFDMAEKLSAMSIAEPSGRESVADLMPQIRSIAYFIPTFVEGKNLGCERTVAYLDCINVRDSFDTFTTKNSASVFQTMRCEGIFGCYYALTTNYSIHCYTSINLQRCLEVDTAKNCSDCMFCHNVENLSDCMFCFNVKNKRFAIGNAEVGKEKYMQVKKMVQEYLARELEAKGTLPFDIYDVLEYAMRKP